MSLKRKPSHPGEFFKFNVLDNRGISIASAAEHLGLTRKAMQKFVNGDANCSVVMARRIADVTGTSVGMWIRMQAKLDIWEAEKMEAPLGVKLLPVQ